MSYGIDDPLLYFDFRPFEVEPIEEIRCCNYYPAKNYEIGNCSERVSNGLHEFRVPYRV